MKSKVCVAMSGGVDSSVAALLLQQQGYEVAGAFMKNWSLSQAGVVYQPWEDEAGDAEAVCKQLGMQFHIFDFEEQYQKRVVNRFVAEYAQGRTPNPDVLCNQEIKFDLFIAEAKKLGADFMATGHYARVWRSPAGFELHAGVDASKDQSYFLYTLSQAELSQVLFPIGHLHKLEVRALASEQGLATAAKKDSQGICFIGPVSMRRFLKNFIQVKPGNVVTTAGTVIGHHDGVMFYTEGQRHGFDTKGNHQPLYVAEKRVSTNELVVAPAGDPALYTQAVSLEDVTWTTKPPQSPVTVQARVRYRQSLHHGILETSGKTGKLIFDQPILHVSHGQSAVWYEDDRLLGGAIIH